MLSNEIPRIPDASGALASRFLLIVLRESFYGREDHTIYARLVSELPGILAWALDGLARLTARGFFIQPTSASQSLTYLEDLSSPVMAFVRAECTVRSGVSVAKSELYAAYRTWCQGNGQSHVDIQPVFGRNLLAALPFIDDGRAGGPGQQTPIYRGVILSTRLTTNDTYVV